MNNKIFKKSLFGFNKKCVIAEFEQLINQLEEKEAEIAALKGKIETYDLASSPTIASELPFKEKFDDAPRIILDSTPAEKNQVASIVIKAEEIAKTIVEDAHKEANTIHAQIRSSIQDEKVQLKELNTQIANLRGQIAENLKNLDASLEKMYIEIK